MKPPTPPFRRLPLLLALLLPLAAPAQVANISLLAPCLTVPQRLRLADSLATLRRVRQAAKEFRIARDTAVAGAQEARDSYRGFAGALTVEKQRTAGQEAETNKWRKTARRRAWHKLGLIVLEVATVVAAVAL